jgi:serpin B
VLGVAALDERVHEARRALDQVLMAPRQAFSNPGAGGSPGDPLRLQVVNSLWIQSGLQVLDPFLETLERDYGTGMNTVDFDRAVEDARVTINRWVADHTSPSISELLAPGILDNWTRLLVVDAVSFSGSWFNPFDTAATIDGAFTRTDGSQVTVPMLRPKERGGSGERAVRSGYVHTTGWQAVRLLYVGGASMIVLLPDQPNATLDPSAWFSIHSQLADALVYLTMPKFAFSAHSSLAEPLDALGIHDLFDPVTADLSAIDGRRELYVKAVEHEATITVDEYGTSASAATAAVIERVSKPLEVTVTLDRPFIFVIQDDETKELLFVGRVADPSAH